MPRRISQYQDLSDTGRRVEKLLEEWSLSNARRAIELVQENLSLKQAIFDLAQDNDQMKDVLRTNADQICPPRSGSRSTSGLSGLSECHIVFPGKRSKAGN